MAGKGLATAARGATVGSMRSKLSGDIVIVGAGAAGLVHTIRPRHSARPVELGAEFIHGRPESFWKLLDEAGLLAYDASERFDTPRIGRVAQDHKFWEHVEEVTNRLSKLPDDPTRDLSFADFTRQYCRDLPSEAVRAATEYVEGFNATDQFKVSALSLTHAAKAAERAGVDIDTAYRHAGGYDQVIAHLRKKALAAGDVTIRLGTVVKKVRRPALFCGGAR
jgi:hypothetical protein